MSEVYLEHSGTPQMIDFDPNGSGRYRQGSGEHPYQGIQQSILSADAALRARGLSESERADILGCKSVAELRTKKSLEKQAADEALMQKMAAWKEKGVSVLEISRRTGIPEATVRYKINHDITKKKDTASNVAEVLKKEVEDKTYLDIGPGVEKQLGITQTKLKTAVALLEDNGYKKTTFGIENVSNRDNKITISVLTKTDVPYAEIRSNLDQIKSPNDIYFDDGKTARGILPPVSISSKRIMVRYADDVPSGKERDGNIQLRPGVEDISLGSNNYAQVRIAVDGTHYLKGMATYGRAKDFPEGVDVIFNTNKTSDIPMIGKDKDHSVLKPMKTNTDGTVNMENPFGATIKAEGQRIFVNSKGEKQQSAINIVNDDESWQKWSRNLPSQFLSKQLPQLAERQLGIKSKAKQEEFEDICKLTNPTVKKQMLESFSEDCDSEAVHLKAAAMPRQATHVILPVPSLSEREIFAPKYQNGEEVILIRYPHAGTFEIPRLIVNNNNKEAVQSIGKDAGNAVGINAKVAARLSGADFDGDTVVVIPTKGQNLKTSSPLEELKGFDPQEKYAAYPGMPRVTKKNFNTQMEMGKVSNLITDMTIRGASDAEIAKAVKHSMVVIDAEKHNLDYKRSYVENDIARLKVKYQGGTLNNPAGASTLISSAKGQLHIPYEKEWHFSKNTIDPKTGDKIFTKATKYNIDPISGKRVATDIPVTWKKFYKLKDEDGKTLKDANGKVLYKTNPDGSIYYEEKPRTKTVTKMSRAKDARELSSGTKIENVYADYANTMKQLARDARLEWLKTEDIRQNPEARKRYSTEVESLNAKLNVALMHAPQERRAQLIARQKTDILKKENPDLTRAELKKYGSQFLISARSKTGGKKQRIIPSEKEWEAIQAGAISPTTLRKILSNMDDETMKELATPRDQKKVTASKLSSAKSLLKAGYTIQEAAEAIGVSASTLQKEMG